MAVPVQIESIIKRLANKSIKFIQPIYEAIANSLEANATEISVELFRDNPMEGVLPPKIDGFKIMDNGDGFTEKTEKHLRSFGPQIRKRWGAKVVEDFYGLPYLII